jgi:hypothetical protein
MTKLLWNVRMKKKDGLTSTVVAEAEGSTPPTPQTTIFGTISI